MKLGRAFFTFLLGAFLALFLYCYCLGSEGVNGDDVTDRSMILSNENGSTLPVIPASIRESEADPTLSTGGEESPVNVDSVKNVVASIKNNKWDFDKVDKIVFDKNPLFLLAPKGLTPETTFSCERQTPVLNGEQVQFFSDDRIDINDLENVSSKYLAYLDGIITTTTKGEFNVKLLIDVRALKLRETVTRGKGHVAYLAYMVSEDFFFLSADAYCVKAGNGEFKPLYLARNSLDENYSTVRARTGEIVGLISVSKKSL
ncbi:MAG: hypothetical protein ACOX3T_03995 [Bdellovibrionota bacterium]